jgi:hypothetical protein
MEIMSIGDNIAANIMPVHEKKKKMKKYKKAENFQKRKKN